jgi:hypothetical protein
MPYQSASDAHEGRLSESDIDPSHGKRYGEERV